MNETIDFKDYIFGGETWLNVKGLNGVEPEMVQKQKEQLELNKIPTKVLIPSKK